MIKVEQTKPDNCFAACIASILELPIESIPAFEEDQQSWFQVAIEWLKPMGLSLMFISAEGNRHPMGYSILCAHSPRSFYNHCVVAFDGEPVWDPSPRRVEGIGSWEYWVVFTCLDPHAIKEASWR